MRFNPLHLLPHRYPFLLLDDIEVVSPGQVARVGSTALVRAILTTIVRPALSFKQRPVRI